MKKAVALIAGLLLGAALFCDSRSESIDFFILFDKSKSMENKIEKARSYTAQEILGRYVMPNDWVCLIEFYGTTNIVFKGMITNEQTKKQLIQSLLKINANGRYTDIGNALDVLKQEVIDRGNPERPKYILLITDLRQEAPPQSKYKSPDYTISHPALEYILKQEIDGFYIITVGMTIENKAQDLATYIIETLKQLPERDVQQIPGAASNSSENKQESLVSKENSLSQNKQIPISYVILILGLCIAAGLSIVMVLLYSRKKHSEKKDSA